MVKLKKINLANIPTPIEICKFENKQFLIKRDDLTGCELSGNKVRKLEYLIYDAKKNNADIIFTSGGEQSNHARAVTITSKKIGVKTKLFLWGSKYSKLTGNLFLNKIYNAELKLLNKADYTKVNDIMIEEANFLRKSKGVNAYIIPEGGSNVIGIWGYFNFIDELSNQVKINQLKGIVLACGSGGTAAGLLAAISYKNLKTKIIVINVAYDAITTKQKILNLAQAFINQFKLKSNLLVDNLIILDGYSNEGYKKIEKEKIKLLLKFSSENGILFDPVYTGKTFFAYYHNFLKNDLGMKYLFLHTGGLFGVFGREKEYLVNS